MKAAPTEADRSQGAQAAAERSSNSPFDVKIRASHASPPRSRSAHVAQGNSISPMTSTLAAAAAATADGRQAEYFVRLLTQSGRRIEQQIDDHQKAIAAAEARGNTEDVRRHRQMRFIAEQDRRTVADLLVNLRQRFPARATGELPRVARRARPAL